jgi:hypothetical protein
VLSHLRSNVNEIRWNPELEVKVLFDDLSTRQSIATAHLTIMSDRESVWRTGTVCTLAVKTVKGPCFNEPSKNRAGRGRTLPSIRSNRAAVFDTVQCSLYFLQPEGYWKLACFRERVMYNVDLVRNLCKTITREKDARKSAELLALLRAVMREDQEEIQVRTAFLANNYSLIGSGNESQAAD